MYNIIFNPIAVFYTNLLLLAESPIHFTYFIHHKLFLYRLSIYVLPTLPILSFDKIFSDFATFRPLDVSNIKNGEIDTPIIDNSQNKKTNMKIIKSLSLAAVIALSAIPLTSCGLDINSLANSVSSVKKTGHSETKDHAFDSSKISGLGIAAGVNATYNVADSAASNTVTIETDEAMMPHVVAELTGNELSIYRKSDISNSDIDINVKVTGPSLSSWKMSSGSRLSVNGTVATSAKATIDISSGASAKFTNIKTPKLTINASSGSAVNVAEFNGGKLSTDASSGAAIKLIGWASYTDFDTSSGGSINSSQLKLTR